MRTLQEAINQISNKGGAGSSLRKHLSVAKIEDWKDITKSSLYDFRDNLLDSLAPSSARTICAVLKSLLNRYSDELTLPKDWEKALSVKGDTTRRTFLTTNELSALEKVHTKNERERIVLVESLIEAYTGARLSDVMTFTEENYNVDGFLTYTSKKTKVTANVPISEKTKGWIEYAQSHRGDEPGLKVRNEIIRRLARRAGINATVKVRRRGLEEMGEKWQYLSSHSFRCSTATNMALAGASLTDIKNTLGHTNENMSSRYVVSTKPNLSEKAMQFFGV